MLSLNSGSPKPDVDEIIMDYNVRLLRVPLADYPQHLRTLLNLDYKLGHGRTILDLINSLTAGYEKWIDVGDLGRIERKLLSAFRDFGELFRGLDGLRGKVVLDIACGARTGKEDDDHSVLFEPWRARLLASLGARVTGIDIRPSANEPYEHVVADLWHGELTKIGSRLFDLIVWCAFFSPDPSTTRAISGSDISANFVQRFHTELQPLTHERTLVYDGRSAAPANTVLRNKR